MAPSLELADFDKTTISLFIGSSGGGGGGEGVSVLAFYSVDPSSNPAEVYSFVSEKCLKKE